MPIAPLPIINPRWLDVAFWMASANWVMWQRDFNYVGPYKKIPVLRIHNRFLSFVVEYNLFQRQDVDARLDALRAIVASNLMLAFADPAGYGIDRLALNLKASGGTVKIELSLLSKLAAFCKPADFNAYDQTARKGLVMWTTGGGLSDYAAYCSRINVALSGPLGLAIVSYLTKKTPPTQNILGFARRMLDVYLMIEGRRWSKII